MKKKALIFDIIRLILSIVSLILIVIFIKNNNCFNITFHLIFTPK